MSNVAHAVMAEIVEYLNRHVPVLGTLICVDGSSNNHSHHYTRIANATYSASIDCYLDLGGKPVVLIRFTSGSERWERSEERWVDLSDPGQNPVAYALELLERQYRGPNREAVMAQCREAMRCLRP